MPDYEFRNGSRVKGGVDAQTVGDELERIRDKHDGITPQCVVDESAPAEAALHECFTWDDAEAANEFRKVEARSIVRSVRVIYPDKPSEPAFVHVRKEETPEGEEAGGYYERASTVVQDFNLYDNAWRAAQDRLGAAAKALDDLERMARDQVNDQAVARAEAVTAAKAKVTEASNLLDLK